MNLRIISNTSYLRILDNYEKSLNNKLYLHFNSKLKKILFSNELNYGRDKIQKIILKKVSKNCQI